MGGAHISSSKRRKQPAGRSIVSLISIEGRSIDAGLVVGGPCLSIRLRSISSRDRLRGRQRIAGFIWRAERVHDPPSPCLFPRAHDDSIEGDAWHSRIDRDIRNLARPPLHDQAAASDKSQRSIDPSLYLFYVCCRGGGDTRQVAARGLVAKAQLNRSIMQAGREGRSRSRGRWGRAVRPWAMASLPPCSAATQQLPTAQGVSRAVDTCAQAIPIAKITSAPRAARTPLAPPHSTGPLPEPEEAAAGDATAAAGTGESTVEEKGKRARGIGQAAAAALSIRPAAHQPCAPIEVRHGATHEGLDERRWSRRPSGTREREKERKSPALGVLTHPPHIMHQAQASEPHGLHRPPRTSPPSPPMPPGRKQPRPPSAKAAGLDRSPTPRLLLFA